MNKISIHLPGCVPKELPTGICGNPPHYFITEKFLSRPTASENFLIHLPSEALFCRQHDDMANNDCHHYCEAMEF